MAVVTTRVLLVEDNPLDVLILKEALNDVPGHGLVLSTAGTLKAALESMAATRFDAALLDLSLPDAEGLEIVHRTMAVSPDLPIVVLTGRDDSELAVEAVRGGAQDYLVKGRVDGQLLVRAVRYAVERHRSRDALEKREKHFRRLIENASDLVAVLDLDLKMRFVGPSVERIAGYDGERLAGASIVPLIHPDDLACLLEAIDTARRGLSQPAGDPNEFRFRHADGQWLTFEFSVRSLFDDPVIAGFILNAHDVTARKNADRRLRDLNDRLAAVIDNAPLAIIRVDPNGVVEEWSKGAEKIFGWTEAELSGKPLPFLHDGQYPADELLKRALNGDCVSRKEIRRKRLDGTVADILLWTALLRSGTGDAGSVLALMADVTEQKKLEEQFRHAQKMEAVGRLAGGVAHDFNNLLTVIIGYAQLAARRIGSSDGADELEEVLAASERAASLTRQLLALSRRQIVEPVLSNVNSLVTKTERIAQQLMGENIEVQTRLESNLPDILVDPSQVELVLLNLATNARDAMPAGGRLLIETQLLAGKTVVIRVSDSGVGMSGEVLARAFEPFFTTKDPGRGTGLGLSTSYAIVRQHGGEILVSSVPGHGTTFEIRFPVARQAAAARPADQVPAPVVRATGTILLVEDESVVARVMRDTLARNGYSVLVAGGVPDALAIARDYPGAIDLLLSDVVLRGGHGLDLARRVRESRGDLPVLFVSGYPDPIGESGLEPPAALLSKPFTTEALLARVQDELSRAARRREG